MLGIIKKKPGFFPTVPSYQAFEKASIYDLDSVGCRPAGWAEVSALSSDNAPNSQWINNWTWIWTLRNIWITKLHHNDFGKSINCSEYQQKHHRSGIAPLLSRLISWSVWSALCDSQCQCSLCRPCIKSLSRQNIGEQGSSSNGNLNSTENNWHISQVSNQEVRNVFRLIKFYLIEYKLRL